MNTHLIYHSIAKPNISEQDVQDILYRARSFNSQNNITGCLLFHKYEFLQILEGEEKIVKKLFKAIQRDIRHSHVTMLYERFSKKRYFSEWDMAFAQLSDKPMQRVTQELGILESINTEKVNKENLPYRLFCSIGDSILKYNITKEKMRKKTPSFFE